MNKNPSAVLRHQPGLERSGKNTSQRRRLHADTVQDVRWQKRRRM